MAFLSQTITVGTTPTLLVGETQAPKTIILSGSSIQNVYIGNGSVTTATGTQGDHIANIQIRLGQTDSVYGIVATGTHALQVITIT
tara:strand:- start:180 stop:437 length:258 start_codon:yes stop_codon:yes gene_type:complete